jgi:membrane fusion protein (multidrug efflux system)
MNVHREAEVEVQAPRRTKPRLAAMIAALILGGFVIHGIVERHSNVVDLQKVADQESIPPVQVMTPSPGPATRSVTLPGNIKAWYTAPIYAQVSGYVRKWYVDYGAFVKAGTLLATIEAPTVDAQYHTALADLAVAKTNSTLSDVTAARWKTLAGTEAVSQEDVDIKVADSAAKKALVQAAEDEVERNLALIHFENIVAPFDGVVTARATDIGNYVSAAGGDMSAHGEAAELFSMADVHAMRIFVSVPQDYAAMLKEGLQATFTVPQYPDRVFKAQLLTTAKAFDPETRTVVTELVAQNPDHLLWPGTYASVRFDVPADNNLLVIPEQALLFREQGMQVALVDSDNRVHLQNVKLGVNLGQNVQVTSGLKPTDRIIVSPSAGILEGEKVQVVNGVAGIGPDNSARVTAAQSTSTHAGDQMQAHVETAGIDPK